MKNFSSKLNTVANVLIIITTILVSAFLIQKFLYRHSSELSPKIGSRLNLADVDYQGKAKNLILVLRKDCHFCSESSPFYKKLIEIAKTRDVQVVAVLPTGIEESKSYLESMGLIDIKVTQSNLSDLQVGGTPTLIMTNNQGEVTKFWVGKLDSDVEDEVVSLL
jgi:thioredoxin-related protein